MLEVCNLEVCYRDTWAIRDVSFHLEPGQITNLLGPNGAGKSTILKAILGLIPRAGGWVNFGGQPLKTQLQRVAYVPQRASIDWDYPVTVWNVVMMGRIRQTGWFRRPSRQSKAQVQAALERVGMGEYANCQIGELSGGQQQRVFLARALVQQADLLFFDEPFTGIDKKTEATLFNVFAELKSLHKTLLIISHDLGETLTHYDRFLLLNKSLIAAGDRQEVLTAANLEKAYGKKLSWLAA